MSHRPLILVIEDEEMLLSMEKVILERAGYRVAAFNSGEAALATPVEELRETRLALVDAVFGGSEAVQALRRMNPEIKTAIVTGKDFDPHPDIDRIIYLPYRPADLLRHVQELLP